MKDHFELKVFCKSRFTSNNTNLLSRIHNSVVDAFNARFKKLPAVIVMVINTDFIEALQINEISAENSATLYGSWIQWLATTIAGDIKKREKQLPLKSKGKNSTIVYWPTIPNHRNFDYDTRIQIAKFNRALESVMKTFSNMRYIKIMDGWNYNDMNLVTPLGRVTHMGRDHIWEAIDLSVKFNYNKRLEYLTRCTQVLQKTETCSN